LFVDSTNEENHDEGKSIGPDNELEEIRNKKPCDYFYQRNLTIFGVSVIYSFIEASYEQCSNYHELIKLSLDSGNVLTPMSILNYEKRYWIMVERVHTFKGFFFEKFNSFLKNRKEFINPTSDHIKSKALNQWWDTINEDLITILRFEFVFFFYVFFV
jgi:hypothetical protein